MISNKDEVVAIRLSKDELDIYLKELDKLNQRLPKKKTKSEFFRNLILNNFKEDLHEIEIDSVYGGLLFYFNKASNNINQVAKRIHQESLKGGGDLKLETLNAILGSLNRLNENFRTGIKEFSNEIKK